MTYDCAWKLDQGRDVRQEISMIKAYATEMAVRVLDRASVPRRVYARPEPALRRTPACWNLANSNVVTASGAPAGTWTALGIVPRPQIAHFPLAVLGPASGTLQP